MGVRNLRAICPNCGAKIHTQPKGLGHITWANSWLLAQTGTECPQCGVALTGKIKANNQAELANDGGTTFGGFVKTKPRAVTSAPGIMPAHHEGWWPDPTGRYEQRYFSGRFWTQHVADGTEQLEDPEPVKVSR